MSENLAKKLVSNELIKQKNAEFSEFLEGLEFEKFSRSISLQDYQQGALKNACFKALYGKAKS
ncbi:hypothetical protein DMC01_11835 [Campylobacter troglodytis]|nr:hypothetical protein DMC01_11835 [Campylobacter troglodytis]